MFLRHILAVAKFSLTNWECCLDFRSAVRDLKVHQM